MHVSDCLWKCVHCKVHTDVSIGLFLLTLTLYSLMFAIGSDAQTHTDKLLDSVQWKWNKKTLNFCLFQLFNITVFRLQLSPQRSSLYCNSECIMCTFQFKTTSFSRCSLVLCHFSSFAFTFFFYFCSFPLLAISSWQFNRFRTLTLCNYWGDFSLFLTRIHFSPISLLEPSISLLTTSQSTFFPSNTHTGIHTLKIGLF